MRHRVKKIKFQKGRDAAVSLMRHLALNLIRRGRIETTITKARQLKKIADRLVHHAKKQKEKAHYVLLSYLNDIDAVHRLIDIIVPDLGDRLSGFTTLVKTRVRLGDGSLMARVEWVKPTQRENSKFKNEEKKNERLSHTVNKTG